MAGYDPGLRTDNRPKRSPIFVRQRPVCCPGHTSASPGPVASGPHTGRAPRTAVGGGGVSDSDPLSAQQEAAGPGAQPSCEGGATGSAARLEPEARASNDTRHLRAERRPFQRPREGGVRILTPARPERTARGGSYTPRASRCRSCCPGMPVNPRLWRPVGWCSWAHRTVTVRDGSWRGPTPGRSTDTAPARTPTLSGKEACFLPRSFGLRLRLQVCSARGPGTAVLSGNAGWDTILCAPSASLPLTSIFQKGAYKLV